jgi:2-oxoglutarate dehydrogenase E2 component (dihydrolipoamide succinyltransferase)
MPIEVRVPTTGESVAEATVGAWLKHEGEHVEAGQPLVEIETDKVNVEVAAERSGVLEQIERREGDSVQPGDLLAILTEAPAQGHPAATPEPDGGTDRADSESAASPEQGSATPAADRPHASPLASRIAKEHGVDLTQVPGTGTGGRVTREDVEQHVAQRGTAPAQPPPPPPAPRPEAAPPAPPQPAELPVAGREQRAPEGRAEERVRMSRRRLTIAQRLVEAQRTAAMLTTFNEVDLSAVMELRARQRESFKERHGVGLGFMSFFTKAVVAALKAFPRLNAEIQGEEIVLKRYYDIGIAVAAEDGLVVPVVRDANRKSFAEIEREIADLVERTRSNRLTLDDLRGGTFTITNGGVFGSLLSTPILSPPQVGILGMHRIQERPIAHDGNVVIRPMMYVALTYDHRIVDGAEAVQFLVRVKELIEDPEALLLEN